MGAGRLYLARPRVYHAGVHLEGYMRTLALLLIVCWTAVATGAQVIAPLPPVFYGSRNSVIDHNGRLVVFDGSYLYPPLPAVNAAPVVFPPMFTTHITVIESDASSKRDQQYGGTFQVVGAGRYAVYATVITYPLVTASSQSPVTATRQLVAIGPSFPTLPSIDVPVQADVKVSAVGDDGVLNSAFDTIAVVDNVVTPVMGVPSGIGEPLP